MVNTGISVISYHWHLHLFLYAVTLQQTVNTAASLYTEMLHWTEFPFFFCVRNIRTTAYTACNHGRRHSCKRNLTNVQYRLDDEPEINYNYITLVQVCDMRITNPFYFQEGAA